MLDPADRLEILQTDVREVIELLKGIIIHDKIQAEMVRNRIADLREALEESRGEGRGFTRAELMEQWFIWQQSTAEMLAMSMKLAGKLDSIGRKK